MRWRCAPTGIGRHFEGCGTGQMAARALGLARARKVREVADDMLAHRLFPLAETGAPVPE
jgi:hypothetical protein